MFKLQPKASDKELAQTLQLNKFDTNANKSQLSNIRN